MPLKQTLFSLLTLFALTSCVQETKPPKLVVVLTVDHLAQEVLTHYSPLFEGGFKWLLDHGAVFNRMYHEHGYTATGPGHFVLGSGKYPGPAGVLGNSWYDRSIGESRYVVEDPETDSLSIYASRQSYRQINATAMGDWLKESSPDSKVFSLAVKDRAAILMGGKHPDLAIWYNWRGAFTTTDYYTSQLPEWLLKFRRDNDLLVYRDSLWTKSLPDSVYDLYAHPDFFQGESDRFNAEEYSPVFPIGFDADMSDQDVLSRIGGYPWIEEKVLELANIIIDAEALGQDQHPDLLLLGFSALDLVAHYYGPYSHEAMDYLIKLDSYLAAFIHGLDGRIGLENITFVVTSDHAGLPLPEHLNTYTDKYAGRVDWEAYQAARAAAYARLDSIYGSHGFIHRSGLGYYFNPDSVKALNVDVDLVTDIMQEHLEAIEGVHRVYSKSEFTEARPHQKIEMRMKRFMHPDLSPDLYVVNDEYWIFRSPYGTTHGMPYDHDSHVPFVVASKTLGAQVIQDSVSTADVAPTVAAILGVMSPEDIDGVSHLSLIQ